MQRETEGAGGTAKFLSDVDDVSFAAVFDSADAYSSKLLDTVQTRRREVEEELRELVEAARLMGATCFFAGVSPAMAQTMTSFDRDLSAIRAFGTLRAALAAALEHVGFRVRRHRVRMMAALALGR